MSKPSSETDARRDDAFALPRFVVLGEPQEGGGGQLRLRVDARGLHDRAARGGGLGAQPSQAVRGGDDDRRLAQDLGPRLAANRGADTHAVAEPERDRRSHREARRAQQDGLPAVEAPERA